MVDKNDEQILVIRSDILFQKGKWQGLKTESLDYYIDLIKKNAEFKTAFSLIPTTTLSPTFALTGLSAVKA